MDKQVSALIVLAQALRRQGDYEEAEKAFLKCLDIEPKNHLTLHLYSGLLIALERFNEAAAASDQSIRLLLSDPNQLVRLGFALWKLGDLEGAKLATASSVSMDLKCQGGWLNLAGILCDEGRVDEAIQVLSNGIKHNPSDIALLQLLGNLCKQQGDVTTAEKVFLKVIVLAPESIQTRESLADIYTDKAMFSEALIHLESICQLVPDYNYGRFLLALMKLRFKRFREGWNMYESRFTGDWQSNGLVDRSDLYERKPRLSNCKSGRVLILSEQGIGDQIMFLSIVPELLKGSNDISIQCDSRLHSILRRSMQDKVKLFSLEDTPCDTQYEYEVPMGSLAMLYRKTIDSYKQSSAGYLLCDPHRYQAFRDRLSANVSKLKVGVSWRSSLDRAANRAKSLRLQKLLNSIALPGMLFVNLQYGDTEVEWSSASIPGTCSKIALPDLDKREDIDGLAALIKACDIVVTIDNATAHLSGALGSPTLLLLPFCCDWRWGINSPISYWYDSLLLLRQQSLGEWDCPLSEARTLLDEFK
jgi:tetratricopeptide (TPR) repeat protein